MTVIGPTENAAPEAAPVTAPMTVPGTGMTVRGFDATLTLKRAVHHHRHPGEPASPASEPTPTS